MTVVTPEEAVDFLKSITNRKISCGVGKKTVPKMHELGIFYRRRSVSMYFEMMLIQQFGKMGYSLYRKYEVSMIRRSMLPESVSQLGKSIRMDNH